MKNLAAILGILFLILIFPALCFGLVYIDIYLYGDREIYCIEDDGATFNATISDEFWDVFFYFEKSEGGFQFKGTDDKVYRCRGIAEIG